MSETPSQAEAGLLAVMAETVAPVREHLATIDREIDAKERELSELRAVRNVALKIIRAVDPTAPGPGPKAKGTGRKVGGEKVTDEYVAKITAYLADHYGRDDDLVAVDLARDRAFIRSVGGQRSQKVSAALRVLHEEGTVRLDRKEGLRKVYRLTTGGDDNGRP